MVYNNSNFIAPILGKRKNEAISTTNTLANSDTDKKIKRMEVRIPLFEVSPEIFGKIFSYISLAELSKMSVSKEFYKLLLSTTYLGLYHLVSNPKLFKKEVGALEIQDVTPFRRLLFRFALANSDIDQRLKDGSLIKEFLNQEVIKLTHFYLPMIQLHSTYQIEEIEKALEENIIDKEIIQSNPKIAINVNDININIKALRVCIEDLKKGRGITTDEPKVIDFFARSIQMGVTIKDRTLETTKKATLQEIFSDHIDIVHKKLCDVKSKIAQEQDKNKAHSLSDFGDSLLNLLLTFEPKGTLSSYRQLVCPEITSRKEKVAKKILLSVIKNPHISYSCKKEFRSLPDLWENREFLLCALKKEEGFIKEVPIKLLKRKFIALNIVKQNLILFLHLPTSIQKDKLFQKACFESNPNFIRYFSTSEKIQHLKKDPTLIVAALTPATDLSNRAQSHVDVDIIINSYLKDNKDGLKCFVMRKQKIYFEIKKDGKNISLQCDWIIDQLLTRYHFYLTHFSDEFQKGWIARQQKFIPHYRSI